MQLKVWLSEKKKNAGWLAKKIGVTPVAAGRYIRGVRRPEEDAMIAIYVATGGAVAPNDFYCLPNLHAGDSPQLSLLDACERAARSYA